MASDEKAPIDSEVSSLAVPGGFENPVLSPEGAATKPDEFSESESWGDRLLKADKPLSFKHKKFCECVAQGLPVPKIKEITGYSDAWISVLKSNSRIQEEIGRLQDKIFSETVQQQLQNLGDDAVATVEEMLRSDEKLKDRVETARWLIEKLTGKARQEVEVGAGGTLLNLLQKLDQLKAAETTEQTREVIELAQGKNTEDDWMDSWVTQNIPVVANEKREAGNE